MPAIRKEMTTAGLQSKGKEEVVGCGGSRHVGCINCMQYIKIDALPAERGVRGVSSPCLLLGRHSCGHKHAGTHNHACTESSRGRRVG